MESQNQEQYSASRLLHTQTHIWNHIFSFINSMSLKSAIDLNIPDIIHKHGKPMPLSLLISSLQIHPSKSQNVYRLMLILTHTGFFSLQKLPDEAAEEGYDLTDASNLLLKDNPSSVTPFLLYQLDPILTKPRYKVANWFQNDDPTPFHTAHGKT
ncbi:trans-resveratrol di-O-methyltransferase-like [Neltuma alba]|uniref:trans-resveratrol di-O-methyltransferase-like n=1 Tax=Neltuma alba TaxID=207710 RepID=UPI0010A4D6C4|nr:trans-resveratrol di-O-methyltransferase-like [Prosopis alba]